MSDTFSKVNGYISATATILKSLFFMPIKTMELAEPADTGILGTINTGIGAISTATSCIYIYNKYIKVADWAKWLIFSFVIVHIIAVGALVALIVQQKALVTQKQLDSFNYGIKRYVLPVVSVAMGGINVWIIVKSDKSAYMILNTINKFSGLADFGPLFEAMKTQPLAYYPVHVIRNGLQAGEGIALFLELLQAEGTPATQPASSHQPPAKPEA